MTRNQQGFFVFNATTASLIYFLLFLQFFPEITYSSQMIVFEVSGSGLKGVLLKLKAHGTLSGILRLLWASCH